MLSIARFVGLTLGALNLGLSFAHLVAMRPKRRMTGPEWLTTQQAYADFGKVARFTLPGALAAAFVMLLLTRSRRFTAALTAVGAACAAAPVAIWAIFNEPVNRAVVDWAPDALPADWAAQRDRWEFAHAASAGCQAVSFGALLAAALWDTPSRRATPR